MGLCVLLCDMRFWAERSHFALRAERFSGKTDMPPEPDHPMVDATPFLSRKKEQEILLNMDRIGVFSQTKALAYTFDMSVHS